MNKIFTVIALFVTFCGFTEETPNQLFDKTKSSDYAETFLLPIDHSNKPKTTLVVNIPVGFKPVQTLAEFTKGFMIEYIPQNEVVDHWSEIITVHKFIGMKISATTLVNEVKKQLLLNAKDSKVLQNINKGPTKSYLLMQYTHEGVQEILSANYFSGPYDCAGVQYTIRVSPQMSRDAALKKIEGFQKTVEVLKN